jgi:hypothetical protein
MPPGVSARTKAAFRDKAWSRGALHGLRRAKWMAACEHPLHRGGETLEGGRRQSAKRLHQKRSIVDSIQLGALLASDHRKLGIHARGSAQVREERVGPLDRLSQSPQFASRSTSIDPLSTHVFAFMWVITWVSACFACGVRFVGWVHSQQRTR